MGDGFDYAMDCMDAQRPLYEWMRENVWDEEHEPCNPPVIKKALKCKLCDSKNVRWKEVNDRWVMMNSWVARRSG